MISLELNFTTMTELIDFVVKMNPITQPNAPIEKPPRIKKGNDKRDLNVKQLHINAKKYQEEHPDTPYRQALKLGNAKEINV